jgi:uncharacterized repeat protein (TIGR01451 family)
MRRHGLIRLRAQACPSIRRPTSILSLIALLAVSLSFIVAGTAGPAGAAAPSGYQTVPSWTAGTPTSTTKLPGSAAAFGNVALTQTDSKQANAVSPLDGVMAPRIFPNKASDTAMANCLVGHSAAGDTNTCGTFTVTLTLPHPTVNPVVGLFLGGGGNSAGTWCTAMWENATFSAVNGAAPAAGQLTATSIAANSTFTANQLAMPTSYVQSIACGAPNSGESYIRVNGLVSSVSFTYTFMAMTTRNPSGTAVGVAATGGVMTNLLVPVADLAITKSAPALVASNGTITWTINVSNNGPADSHGFIVRDAVPAGVSSASLVSAPAGCALSGTDLVCSKAPPGCSAAQNATVSTAVDLTCGTSTNAAVTVLASGASFGPIVLSATAPSAAGATVNNTATVAGADTDPNPVNNTATTPTAVQSPSLTLTKSGSPSTVTAAGQTVTYGFLVTNTGNVPLTSIGISESAFTGTGPTPVAACPSASLAVGASETCTAMYAVTQADVDSGSVHNTATAHGTPPGTSTPVNSPPSSATVTVTPAPAVMVVKSASPSDAASFTVGRVITYSFVVTNTGNVTLANVRPVEGAFTGSGVMSAPVCPAGAASLVPGGQVTCTSTYTVTQADVDAGVVTNSATSTGTPPSGVPPVSPPSIVTVPGQQTPAITVVKSATPAAVGVAGDTVSYSFVVTNTGNVTLANVRVNESAFSGTGTAPVVTCPAGAASLAPGARVTCTATYMVTQADVDAGSVSNTATATGTPPSGPPPVSPPSTTTITATPAPALTVAKTANPTTVTATGQTVTYSFLVTNTGNVTLHAVGITETAFSGTGTPPAATCPSATLAPGAFETCTATYTVTQADVNAGEVTNTATAHGTPPGSSTPANSPPGSATVTAPPTPAITVVKSASPASPHSFTAGQSITYSFVVTNTGNVTLTNVHPTEGTFTGSGTLSAPACPAGAASLAPGAQVTCTATYTVTQADIDAGSITNTATGTGTPPSGPPPVSPPTTVTVPQPAAPGITVAKSATPAALTTVGATVTYSFLVTNTGNVTLTNATINEGTFTGTGTLSPLTCPAAAASLAPGARVTCTATYTVTQADVNAGSITNTATVTGTPPSGPPTVSPPSTVKVPFTATSKPVPGGGGGTLPVTGAHLRLPMILGFLLVGIGGLLLLLGVRWRRVLS